jgi:hypothetical protein
VKLLYEKCFFIQVGKKFILKRLVLHRKSKFLLPHTFVKWRCFYGLLRPNESYSNGDPGASKKDPAIVIGLYQF